MGAVRGAKGGMRNGFDGNMTDDEDAPVDCVGIGMREGGGAVVAMCDCFKGEEERVRARIGEGGRVIRPVGDESLVQNPSCSNW
jgi:hypothetical protein